jgi:hypothetical protein
VLCETTLRVSIWMALPPAPPRLTATQYLSLCEVAKGALRPIIPDEHRAYLIKVGYIKEGLFGLVLTTLGRLRVAADD